MRPRMRIIVAVVFVAACADNGIGQNAGQPAKAADPSVVGSEQHPARVSGGVMAGQVLHKANPIYPPITKDAKVAGAVVLAVLIDDEGKVKKATVISGPEVLREPTLEAVRHWTYKPFLLNGKAVFVQTTVTVHVTFGSLG